MNRLTITTLTVDETYLNVALQKSSNLERCPKADSERVGV